MKITTTKRTSRSEIRKLLTKQPLHTLQQIRKSPGLYIPIPMKGNKTGCWSMRLGVKGNRNVFFVNLYIQYISEWKSPKGLQGCLYLKVKETINISF